MSHILEIENLNLDFKIKGQQHPALENISIKVDENQIVGIVGESGSGKSLTARTILGIAPDNATVSYDKFLYKGEDLPSRIQLEKNHLRSKEISMIFQDPLSSLNPLYRVGKQIEEVLAIHNMYEKKARRTISYDLLRSVGFVNPEEIYRKYPYELSGGMRQRIMICIALIGQPNLIIADEPTTALDTTIQKQILDILKALITEQEKSLILISHDWGVINEMCDVVYVMYAGRVVEFGKVEDIVRNPSHSYTRALLRAIPSIRQRGKSLFNIPFKVASITERQKGNWPYIQTNEDNRQYIAEHFPEFVTR